MTVIHPKPFNQSPVVLLLNASELIQDVLDQRLTGALDLQAYLEDDKAWSERALTWSRDYGAYINREFGDDNV